MHTLTIAWRSTVAPSSKGGFVEEASHFALIECNQIRLTVFEMNGYERIGTVYT